ncbi:hypothetical protein [Parasitella parasitica]|uniref:Uncharacterized protein n=1 Tax=Parasitella parasitica TaxID=35722 RepID=A0A0B7MMC9_9FUNG|nr:hypothetical protein [Parasitella parasitica]
MSRYCCSTFDIQYSKNANLSLTSVIVILGIAYSVNAASILPRGEDVCKSGAGAAGFYPVANSETQYVNSMHNGQKLKNTFHTPSR